MIPPIIKSVKPLDDFYLKITYVTGEKKLYDMKKNFKYNFFRNLSNISYFKLAKPAGITVEWPNGEDIDPNDLYSNSINID